MRPSIRILPAASAIVVLLTSGEVSAFSVLAHEAVVDAPWKGGILPVLASRFPRATEAELEKARAFALGALVHYAADNTGSSAIAKFASSLPRWPSQYNERGNS